MQENRLPWGFWIWNCLWVLQTWIGCVWDSLKKSQHASELHLDLERQQIEMGVCLGGTLLEELRKNKLEEPRKTKVQKEARVKAEASQEREWGGWPKNWANREEGILSGSGQIVQKQVSKWKVCPCTTGSLWGRAKGCSVYTWTGWVLSCAF